jgi:hypothetical protein
MLTCETRLSSKHRGNNLKNLSGTHINNL